MNFKMVGNWGYYLQCKVCSLIMNSGDICRFCGAEDRVKVKARSATIYTGNSRRRFFSIEQEEQDGFEVMQENEQKHFVPHDSPFYMADYYQD